MVTSLCFWLAFTAWLCENFNQLLRPFLVPNVVWDAAAFVSFLTEAWRVMYEQSIINYLPRPIQSCTTFRVAHEQGYVPAVGLLQIFDDVVWTKFRRTCWSVVVICLRKANMFITVALPRLLYPVHFCVATSSACTSFHHRKTTDKSADRTTVSRLVLHSFKYSR